VLPLPKQIADAYRVDQSAREHLWRQMRHSSEFRRARALVRRTVLEHFAAGTGRKWLLVTSMENYFACLGRVRWGKGAHKLGAEAIVTTPVYRSSDATWADRQYPYRIDFEVIADPATPDLRLAVAEGQAGYGAEMKRST